MLQWSNECQPVLRDYGFLKGKLALWRFEQFPSLGRKYWTASIERYLWSRGYYVSMTGIDEGSIRHYVWALVAD